MKREISSTSIDEELNLIKLYYSLFFCSFFFFIYTVTHVTYVHIFGYLLRGQGILLKMLTLYNSEYSLRGSCGITPNLLY